MFIRFRKTKAIVVFSGPDSGRRSTTDVSPWSQDLCQSGYIPSLRNTTAILVFSGPDSGRRATTDVSTWSQDLSVLTAAGERRPTLPGGWGAVSQDILPRLQDRRI
ncbi:hypothetical protein J6590_068623 [Homalodisca vitripennis]|nr:hypothetical protein J6590_068623 [Homalodisca vitripennis]